jgi:hypothetical protein
MLSEAKLEAYRKMTVEERWREVEALMTDSWRFLKELPGDEMRRRLSLARAAKEESDRAMLEHLRNLP